MTRDGKRRWYRFSLRGLLAAIAIGALLVWGSVTFWQWCHSVPIAQVIDAFSSRMAGQPYHVIQPPLTEQQVVDSIEAQLPALKASPQVKGILSRIVRSGRLPHKSGFSFTGRHSEDGAEEVVGWIDLDLMTGKDAGYTIKIRKAILHADANDRSKQSGDAVSSRD